MDVRAWTEVGLRLLELSPEDYEKMLDAVLRLAEALEALAEHGFDGIEAES